MTAKKNILIVEDEALIRDGIRSLLEGEQFVKTIAEASNKKEFLSQLNRE